MIRLELSIAGGFLLLCAAGSARADEPVGAREPHLMSETAEITTVADAFDEDDPFDLNLVIGFTQSWKHAKVRRESQIFQPGLASGGFVPATENIASYSSSTSTLLVGADVGIYKDLALVFRVPLILSWAQSLGSLNNSAAVTPMLLADPLGGQLFSVPFTSPTRSGVDYISAGIDWAIFNQQRDATKPTWVIGVEGRLGVGSPLHACNANAPAGTPECPDPSDPTNMAKNRQPGISQAYDTLIARTVWSRRFGYVEPYTGFTFQAQFAQQRGDFGAYNVANDLDRTPPLLGSFTLGLEVVPYEHREQYQRLSADFRFKGTYQSPGRDYSELFDALGSTNSQSLRIPNPAMYTAGPGSSSVAKPGGESVYFNGITEEQAYGSFTMSASTTWQAGEYVKFSAGGAFTYVQPHLVTAADTCTPNNSDPTMAGPCSSGGAVLGSPNPDHHDIIDLPGHRFSIDDTTVIDLWVMGVVMF
jgi:hypothetical protein